MPLDFPHLAPKNLHVISELVGLFLLAPRILTAQVDWNKLNAETLEHFTMVKIDSSNPPGKETAMAKYIQGVLDRKGFRASWPARIQSC